MCSCAWEGLLAGMLNCDEGTFSWERTRHIYLHPSSELFKNIVGSTKNEPMLHASGPFEDRKKGAVTRPWGGDQGSCNG